MSRFMGLVAASLLLVAGASAQNATDISKTIGTLRSLSDAERAKVTMDLAKQIQRLPKGPDTLQTALGLAFISTEGDFGRDTLQEVTNALVKAVREAPEAPKQNRDFAYLQLAQLQRYEGMRVDLDAPAYRAALRESEALEKRRAKVDFTLTDLGGKTWTRSALKGKIVLVNFWATWCPPCRKEMPDLERFSKEFSDQLVILAISDEKEETVRKFISEKGYSYPILLDPGRKVNSAYEIGGIPQSFLYDRNGKLAAQTIDMRTREQFLKLLAKAGLKTNPR